MSSSRNVVGVVRGVPTVVIIHKAILVVIDVVVGNLRRVHPVVANQIHVVVVGASAFKHSNDNPGAVGRGASGGDVPSQVGIDVVVRVLDVVPLLTQRRVIGNSLALLNNMIELNRLQAPILTQATKNLPILSRICLMIQTEQMNSGARRQRLQVCQTMLIGKLPCIQVMMKLRDELTRNVSLALGIAAQKENGGDGHDGLGNVHVESAV